MEEEEEGGEGEEENDKQHGTTGRHLVFEHSTAKLYTRFPTMLSQRLPAKEKKWDDKILLVMVAGAIGLKTAQME